MYGAPSFNHSSSHTDLRVGTPSSPSLAASDASLLP